MMATMVQNSGRWLYLVLRPLVALFAPRTPRVRVEIRQGNQVLLVKSWFGDQRWALPGGGVERGEAPSRAAIREVFEETGLTIDRKRLDYLTTLPARYPLRCDLVIYATATHDTQLRPLKMIHRLEIIDRKWYDIVNLPDDTDLLTRAIISREYEQFAQE